MHPLRGLPKRQSLYTAVALLLPLLLCGCDLPSDGALIHRFQTFHADFERRRQMVDEDNIDGRIHKDYADPHLVDARLAEYRKLMSADGIMRLWGHGRTKPLELIVDGNGFLAQGDYKGYLYDPGEQQPSSDSLDDSCFNLGSAKKTERSCSAVRSLGGGWWLIRYEYR